MKTPCFIHRQAKTLALAFSLASIVAKSSVQAQVPPHLENAVELLDQITSYQADGIYSDQNGVSINRYGGSWNSNSDPSFIRFADPDNGILPGNNTKCSPLVTHLLKYTYDWNWTDYNFFDPILNINKSTASPYAYQYCELIKQQQGFTQVFTLSDAQPGDILSWWEVGSNASDHTMIIAEVNWASAKPYLLGYPNSNQALAGTTYYEVRVIDSSSSTHTADSRVITINGVSQTVAGLGTGIIGLLVNQTNEIVGRTWSLPTSDYLTKPNSWLGGLTSRLKLAPQWEIVIGRISAQANP